jgi:hypothetical protein
MSLILPAVQQSRMAARNLECRNNLHNLGIAVLGFAETRGGRFPPLCRFENFPGTDDITGFHSWVVNVLPFLDRTDLADRWNHKEYWYVGQNLRLSQFNIPVLTCPDDDSAWGKSGGLTYVANNGYDDGINDPDDSPVYGIHGATAEVFDWDGDGIRNGPADEDYDNDSDDSDIQLETGVFWEFAKHWRGGQDVSLSRSQTEIYDGTSNTLMLTENLKAGASGDRFYGGSQTSWANPVVRNCGFIYNLDPSSGPAEFGEPKANAKYPSHINVNRYWKDDRGPYPSSNHLSQVNAVLCDGSVRSVQEDIDEVVYAKLISPAGGRPRGVPGFLSQAPVSDNQW